MKILNTVVVLLAVTVLVACGGVETTTISPSRLMYNQTATFTIEGPNLDKGITLVAPLCLNIKEAEGGEATKRTFTCTPNTVGDMTVAVTGGGSLLHSTVLKISAPQVTLKSSMGDMVLELNPKAAPLAVKNFLQYVNDGFYTNLIFHRVIAGFVIQAGGFDANLVTSTPRAAIKLEVNNGLSNVRGSLAMARTFEPDSATSQFYINTVDNLSLDTLNGGYAVFGSVVSGLATVDAIGAVPTAVSQSLADVPVTPVLILSMVQTQ
jgi:cyclophilin family peptidyl-prolyl cis-trans isomerase